MIEFTAPLIAETIPFQALIIIFLKSSFVFHKYTITPTKANITPMTMPTGPVKAPNAVPNNGNNLPILAIGLTNKLNAPRKMFNTPFSMLLEAIKRAILPIACSKLTPKTFDNTVPTAIIGASNAHNAG